MKKLFAIFALVFFLLPATYATEPVNIFVAKQALTKYYDSGAYDADIKQVAQSAQQYLESVLKQNTANKKKLAAVFDIDETSIYAVDQWEALGFGGSKEDIEHVITSGHERVITPMQQLYNFAKSHNIAVFFITGRPHHWQTITESNLHAAGYNNWDGLYLRPDDYNQHYKSIVPFKSNLRKELEAKGYDIVLNIGDQFSDLQGGYADKTFKLPNPYYYIP